MMLIFHFWAIFGGKMGVANTASLMVLGLQTQRKIWPSRWNFWASAKCNLEIKISEFSGVNSDRARVIEVRQTSANGVEP